MAADEDLDGGKERVPLGRRMSLRSSGALFLSRGRLKPGGLRGVMG